MPPLNRIPGCAVIIAFSAALLLSITTPYLALTLAAICALYSILRFVFTSLAYINGLKCIRQAQAVNWHQKYTDFTQENKLDWDSVHHVVIIPNYKEPMHILQKSLSNLAHSPEAARMTVVLAMEASETACQAKAMHLQTEYAGKFAQLYYTIHPENLPGELRCKSANQAWAGRWVKQTLVDELGYDLDCIIVTTMDADTLWHEQYFPALTYHFATDPARHQRFWQAPIRYHSNIYQISPLFRFSNIYSTALELGYLAAHWWPSLPISSYSLSLRLLESSDYWDTDVIADEWHMYIKAFFAQCGDLKLTPIYLPFLATAVSGSTFWENLKNRYLQTLRHSWGSKEISYTVAQILDSAHTPRLKSLKLLLVVAHDLTQASAMWVFLTVASQLPLLVHPAILGDILADPLSFPPFIVLQTVVVVISLLGFTLLLLDIREWPPRLDAPTRRERFLSLIGFLLLPIFGVLLVILPVLHAQYQLFVGKQLAFQVTDKA